jgi:hypothetical protein
MMRCKQSRVYFKVFPNNGLLMAGGNRTSIQNPRQRYLTGTSVEPSGRPRSQPTASPSGRSSPIVSSMLSPSRYSVRSSAGSPCPSEAPKIRTTISKIRQKLDIANGNESRNKISCDCQLQRNKLT